MKMLANEVFQDYLKELKYMSPYNDLVEVDKALRQADFILRSRYDGEPTIQNTIALAGLILSNANAQ